MECARGEDVCENVDASGKKVEEKVRVEMALTVRGTWLRLDNTYLMGRGDCATVDVAVEQRNQRDVRDNEIVRGCESTETPCSTRPRLSSRLCTNRYLHDSLSACACLCSCAESRKNISSEFI